LCDNKKNEFCNGIEHDFRRVCQGENVDEIEIRDHTKYQYEDKVKEIFKQHAHSDIGEILTINAREQ
jgi:hypothetical protein